MKTALLLEKLEGQLATLRQRCAPVAQFATLSARFDRHLFQTRATTLQACLDEAGDNLAALRHAVEQQQLPQVAWLAEHLAAQLEAIAREATAWSLREWDSAPPKIARWQRKAVHTLCVPTEPGCWLQRSILSVHCRLPWKVLK